MNVRNKLFARGKKLRFAKTALRATHNGSDKRGENGRYDASQVLLQHESSES
jgi:hypothetical protein